MRCVRLVTIGASCLLSSGLAAQEVSIAIYEAGFSLIDESRQTEVPSGQSMLTVENLPRGVQPQTVVATFPQKSGVRLQGQRYRQASESLLEAFVGQTVKIVSTNPKTGGDIVRDGKLLRAKPGPLVEIDGRVELSPPGRIALPNLPAGAILKPRLELDVDAANGGRVPYRISYLTAGPGWTADYALKLDPDERWALMQGRATLRNPGGRTYRNAVVRLVSGSVNRVSGRALPRHQAKAGMRMMAAESMARADQPVAVSDVQVYPLPRPLDLVAGAEEKVILFDAARVAVDKSYHLTSSANAHVRGRHVAEEKRHPLARITFANDKANDLGIPLPRGVARVYGGDLFLGEDRIAHTAKGERVSLNIGRAVDITSRRKRTDYRAQGLPKGTAEVAYEIALKNAKSNKVTVEVAEQMIGEWRVLSESHPHKRDTDRRALWQVDVPAAGQAILRYRVRVKFR